MLPKILSERNFLPWLTLSTVCTASLTIDRLNAQIIPDATLGSESSIVTPVTPRIDLIQGGATRGVNLFHSFEEFNIGERRAAFFANPAGVQNIFSRVTGTNPSRLFGTLGVLGNANLFFLNPNGIIFGPNASLRVNGSFVATTGNSFVFPDGSRFSATRPEAPPLLSVNVSVPVGVQFEGSGGIITNAGTLEPGGNLTLVGGTIVNTGTLSTFGEPIAVVTTDGAIVNLDEKGGYAGITPSTNTGLKPSLADFVTSGGTATGLSVDADGTVRTIATGTPVGSGDAVTTGSIDSRGISGAAVTIQSQGNIEIAGTGINASALVNTAGQFLGNAGDVNITAGGISSRAGIFSREGFLVAILALLVGERFVLRVENR
jgi:filamentous hemagglutinin family protein